MELDFKDIEARTEKFIYLNPLIDNCINTNKFHLSIIESKKHFDYTIIYLLQSYPTIAKDINNLYNAMAKLDTTQIDKIRNDLWLQDLYKNKTILYSLVNMYAYLLNPLILEISKPVLAKNNKVRKIGSITLTIHDSNKNYTSISDINNILAYFRNEILYSLKSKINTQWKYGRFIDFLPLYYRGQENVQDFEKFNKLVSEVTLMIQKLGYNIKVQES